MDTENGRILEIMPDFSQMTDEEILDWEEKTATEQYAPPKEKTVVMTKEEAMSMMGCRAVWQRRILPRKTKDYDYNTGFGLASDGRNGQDAVLRRDNGEGRGDTDVRDGHKRASRRKNAKKG